MTNHNIHITPKVAEMIMQELDASTRSGLLGDVEVQGLLELYYTVATATTKSRSISISLRHLYDLNRILSRVENVIGGSIGVAVKKVVDAIREEISKAELDKLRDSQAGHRIRNCWISLTL